MDDRFLHDLKSRIDLLEVVRRYVPEVKKAGKSFMCRSPFRRERTPSFSISQADQVWYDFGASEGGDAIRFIEKVENVDFLQALEILADIAGMEIPKTKHEKISKTATEKKDIFALHKAAQEYFSAELDKSEIAKSYLKNRGISATIVEKWGLGYGGDHSTGLTHFLLEKGFSEAQIASSGVAFERSFGDKSMRDRFEGRVMIPIREPRKGQIIAFTGRDILNRANVGKYVNSPENPVYHKSSVLFALEKAREKIKEKNRVILVEGNFDVIAMHEAGFTEAVATCGTALTDDHLRIIKRLTQNIYLGFDTDPAGKRATLRSVEMLLQMELEPYVIFRENAKDLDEFLRSDVHKKKFFAEINQTPRALDFLFDRFAKKHIDKTLLGEKNFLDAFFYFLNLVKRPVEVDDFLTQCAQKLKRSKSIIESEFSRFQKVKTRYQKISFDQPKAINFNREEKFAGFLSLHWEKLQEKIDDKLLSLFSDGSVRKILKTKKENRELEDQEKTQLLSWHLHLAPLYEETSSNDIIQRDLNQFIHLLQSEQEKNQRKTEAEKIKEYLGSH